MFETAGATTILEPAPLLLALVLLPLLGLVAGRGRWAARAAIAASGGSFAVAVGLAVRLALLKPLHALAFQSVPPLARIGLLDLSADLVFDGPSAALLVVGTALATASALHAVWTNALRRLPWLLALELAVALVALADSLPVVAAGSAIATLAAWGLSRGEGRVALGALVASDASIAFGIAALFWALGGTFGPAGYAPDGLPRFGVVAASNAAAPAGKVTVALTTYAGSLVVADEGPPLPGEPLKAPFVVTLEPGTYSFRVQTGVASQDALVSHVALAAGRAYVLTPFGPSASVRNLGDQARISRPALGGEHTLRAALGAPTWIGLREAGVLALFLFGGALLRLARVALGRALALEALPVVILAFRLVPVVEPGPAFALLIALAAAVLAARAAAESDSQRALGSVLAASIALGVACVAFGEPGAALVIVIASVLAAESWRIAEDDAGDVRWLGVACAAATGVIPAAGASTGVASAVASAFAWRQYAFGVAVLVTVALASIASFRVYDANIGAPASRGRPGPAPLRALGATLAVLAIVAGAALGAGTSPFGGAVVPLVRRIVPTGLVVADAPRLAGLALAASLAVAAAGVALARRLRPLPWLDAPGAALAHGGDIAGRAMRFLSRGTRVLDREVVEDVTLAVAGTFVRLGSLVRRAEARLTLGPLDRAGAAAAVRLGSERVRRALLVGMVALLGLVVLSSLVLGR